MSFTVDKLEKNMVKLTIEVEAEEFAKGMETAYEKNKNIILRRSTVRLLPT